MAKLTDKNRLLIVKPDLCKEWNYKKNGDLNPEDVSYGSHKKIWWVCEKKHEWAATVNDRYNKQSGCPYCSGKIVCKDNCLAVINPKFIKEWHLAKNNKLTPYNITFNSSERVWWKCCKCKNEWNASVYTRIRGHNCPYCSGHKVSDTNRLNMYYPKLIEEWNFKKNKKRPSEYSYGSRAKVWWVCRKCNFEWISVIKARTILKSGCPNCRGIALKGGIHCDSIVEAFFYLKYKSSGLKFQHNKRYPKKNNYRLGSKGNARYDFYFLKNNKYVEVTSYSKNEKWWFSYLRNIVKKRKYVKNILGGEFEFIQAKLTKKQLDFVKKYSENYL